MHGVCLRRGGRRGYTLASTEASTRAMREFCMLASEPLDTRRYQPGPAPYQFQVHTRSSSIPGPGPGPCPVQPQVHTRSTPIPGPGTDLVHTDTRSNVLPDVNARRNGDQLTRRRCYCRLTDQQSGQTPRPRAECRCAADESRSEGSWIIRSEIDANAECSSLASKRAYGTSVEHVIVGQYVSSSCINGCPACRFTRSNVIIP